MGKTWNQRPWKLIWEERELDPVARVMSAKGYGDWQDGNGRWRQYHHHGGYNAGAGYARAKWWRAERTRIRRELRAGREPAPTRPRHSVLWWWH